MSKPDSATGRWYSGTQAIDPPAIDPTLPIPRGASLAQRVQTRVARTEGTRAARTSTVLRDAIRRELYRRVERDGPRKLDAIVQQMVQDAMRPAVGPFAAGIAAARREIMDRFAGKAVQPTEHTGAGGAPIQVQIGPRDVDAL